MRWKAKASRVCVVDDTLEPPKPDAIFPNNWVSFHADGTVVLYPMHAENRRRERRRDVVDAAAAQAGFKISRVLDLSHHELQGRCLEGTGSLVLDHLNRVAYASISPRTHPAVVEEWARELGYTAVIFAALDRAGAPVYHTNVLMCIGERFAVVGTGAIAESDRAQRSRTVARKWARDRRDRSRGNRAFRREHAGAGELG